MKIFIFFLNAVSATPTYDSRKVPRTSKSALGPPDENKQASSSHQSIFKQIEELNGKKTKNRSKLDFKQIRKELRHTQ